PRRPVFLKSAWLKPHTGHFCVGAPFSISSAAPMPSSRSARAKLVGSCTPFSFEQASHKFTLCILPSKICVRKTVASLHLQTSHNIFLSYTVIACKYSTPNSRDKFLLGIGFAQSSIENRRAALACHLTKASNDTGGDGTRLS